MPRRLGTQACWGQQRCPCQMLSCSQMLAPETCGCHFRCVCNHQTQPALLQTCSDYSNDCKSVLHTTLHYYQQPICAHQPFSCGPAPQMSSKWQRSCNAIVHHQCVSILLRTAMRRICNHQCVLSLVKGRAKEAQEAVHLYINTPCPLQPVCEFCQTCLNFRGEGVRDVCAGIA